MKRTSPQPAPETDIVAVDPVKIRKAAIRDDLFLYVEYTEELPGHDKKDIKLSCSIPVHEDLKSVFSELPKHLAILTEYIKTKGKDYESIDSAELGNFTAVEFKVSGIGDNEGVTIYGSKEGRFGDFPLPSPFIGWADSKYPFLSELGEHIEACIFEVKEYLFNGKRAPEKQLELGFEGDDAPVTTE